MKENCIKQSVGIDISAESFTACIAYMALDQSTTFSKVTSFSNCLSGFKILTKWVQENTVPDIKISFILEATGVYYENLAFYLFEQEKLVSVVLPNKINHYSKVLDNRSKTDILDAKLIAAFGVERKLELWQPASPIIRKIKQLTREREQLMKDRTRLKNQFHSKEYSFEHSSSSLKRIKKHIKFLDTQIEAIEEELAEILKNDTNLKEKVKSLTSIPGIGLITALIIVAETNGFILFKSRKQLVKYAGYDVVERESGTSLKGKPRISKKGNKHIRKALHMPALNAARFNENLREFYTRLNERKPSKMIGIVAIQRKLLLLMFALWKSGDKFESCYLKSKEVA